MTSHELATQLLQNPNARIVIRGQEGGYNDIRDINLIVLALDVNKNDNWMGDHDDATDLNLTEEDNKPQVVPAITLT